MDIDHVFEVSELQGYLVGSTQNIEIVVVLEGCTDLDVLSAQSSHGCLEIDGDVGLELSFHGVHVRELSHNIDLIEAPARKPSQSVSRLIVRNTLSHEGRDLSVVRQVA